MTTDAYRIAFYGDDFTGSTDALEVLAFAGLKVALFIRTPDDALFQRFPGLEAFGIAGDSRDMTPREMDERLAGVLDVLANAGVRVVHYKNCSTFDSSPSIGSIGRIADMAGPLFNNVFTPVVGATPMLGRYCLFGNLFARSATDGQVYRIDRHPIMREHPVTPMREGDLTLHLAHQTEQPVVKFAFPHLQGSCAEAHRHLETLVGDDRPLVLFDSSTQDDLTVVGNLLEKTADREGCLFVIGGSGVEYALTQAWRESASPPPGPSNPFAGAAPVKQLLALSGSASSLTGAQIETAVEAGFDDVALDTAALLDPVHGEATLEAAMERVQKAFEAGRSVLVHTARSRNDPRIEEAMRLAEAGAANPDTARSLGRRRLAKALGSIAAFVLERCDVERFVVSGGDTSSQVMQIVAPDALEVCARLYPGAPLCRMHSTNPSLNGAEVALKGGQIGDSQFFVRALNGLLDQDDDGRSHDSRIE